MVSTRVRQRQPHFKRVSKPGKNVSGSEFWPGIPTSLIEISASDFLSVTTEIVCQEQQFHFEDFYQISDSLIMEKSTGFLYDWPYKGIYNFAGMGISEYVCFECVRRLYEGDSGFLREFEFSEPVPPQNPYIDLGDINGLLSIIDAKRFDSFSFNQDSLVWDTGS